MVEVAYRGWWGAWWVTGVVVVAVVAAVLLTDERVTEEAAVTPGNTRAMQIGIRVSWGGRFHGDARTLTQNCMLEKLTAVTISQGGCCAVDGRMGYSSYI